MGSTRWHKPVITLIPAVLLLLMVLSAGCTGSLQPVPGPVPVSPAMAPHDNGSWKEYPLTDLQGKGNFSVNMFAGKPVLVSVQSADCPSCIILLSRQLDEIDRLQGVRDGKVVSVSLDLDPAGGAGFITSYHARFNFSAYTTRSPTDLTLDLFHTFGPFAIDTETIPVILVCPDGHDLLLPAGVKTAETLNATLAQEC